MTKAGTGMIRGLRQALAYARGDKSLGRAHTVRVPDKVDVGRIRKRLKLSQTEFAGAFGFSVASVRDWEQKRRAPLGPARVLLTVIAREPDAVHRALQAEPMPRRRSAAH